MEDPSADCALIMRRAWDGKQVLKIHVWNEFMATFGALIFELGEERASTKLEREKKH